MRCPFCSVDERDKVIETRVSKDGREIRRRRECEACERRFTTYERIEESMPLVIKADGRREPFDRNKIEHGIKAAVAKRPVSRDQVSALALDVEREIGELRGQRDRGARDRRARAAEVARPRSGRLRPLRVDLSRLPRPRWLCEGARCAPQRGHRRVAAPRGDDRRARAGRCRRVRPVRRRKDRLTARRTNPGAPGE